MKRKTSQIVTAGVTFTVALGIGTVMQYGDALASRIGKDVQDPPPEVMATPARPIAAAAISTAQLLPQTPKIRVPQSDAGLATVSLPRRTTTPRLKPPGPAVALARATPSADLPVALSTPTKSPQAPTCGAQMQADPGPLAMVDITVTDPCRPGALLTLHHQGMMFQGVTDAQGRFETSVPALSEKALFLADFAHGPGAAATADVPELAQFDRAVLQWQGEADVQLHALEFGAAYFEDGHVWSGAPGDPDAARAGTGGALFRLGDPDLGDALMAEVYTFPSGTTRRDGAVALSVEAEVSARNCGREITAQSIQHHPGAEPRAVDLTMVMPGCDAQGEFLVLKNMFEDLTLASK